MSNNNYKGQMAFGWWQERCRYQLSVPYIKHAQKETVTTTTDIRGQQIFVFYARGCMYKNKFSQSYFSYLIPHHAYTNAVNSTLIF